MNNQQAMRILTPLFWSVGKSDGEQLWMHHYTVWHIFRKMIEVGALPLLGDKEDLVEAACLLHDLKKKAHWNQLILLHETNTDKIIDEYVHWWYKQSVIIDEREKNKVRKLFADGRTDHQIETERDLNYFLKPYLEFVKSELPFELTETNIRMIFDIIKHHFLKEEDISRSELPGFGNYIYILKLCDRLSSMKTIDVNTINQSRSINAIGRKIFDITYFTISRKFGPSTALFSNVLFDKYKQSGWVPLLYFEDGGVVIAKGKGNIPDKEEIVKDCANSISQKTLEIAPTKTGRKSMLTGIAKEHPRSFVLSKKDNLIREFDHENAGSEFLKVFIEVLVSGKMRNTSIRKENPVLDVLFSMHPGTRGISLAQKKWKEFKGDSLPMKEDKSGIDKTSSLNYIFDTVKLEEIVPQVLYANLPVNGKLLKEYSAEELFNILLNLAGQFEKETGKDQRIERYLDEIISMEEEKDFRSIAEKRFEHYKAYKFKPDDKKTGICEICGCTIVQKPGADFAKGQIQAFSQIKAKADVPRKICPFCAYDNSVMRQGAGNWIPVYVKMGSHIPLEFRQEISQRVIKPLKDGIIRIQNIEDMQKRWGILFPSVPVLTGESNYDVIEYIHTTDRTEIVVRVETVNPKDFSPKDQKAKYEPLYHLLNLLGFRVSIGAEEQDGLFGEDIITTEEEYYKSLSVIILSSTIDKKRKYIFAKDMLEKSPSIAISYTTQEYKDKKGKRHLRLKETIAAKLFEFIYKSGIRLFSIEGGVYKMEDLLRDAAFFADKEKGIGHFCTEPENRKDFWNPHNMTKYNTTKPVAQALDEILASRELDHSIERFMRNIAKKISQEEQEELAIFVNRAKDIFAKYYKLRTEKGISDFIKGKNALCSAIYVFTRYPKLKEVCK